MRMLILLLLALILANLARALFHLLRRGGDPTATARALTWRVGLSLALFALLMGGRWWMGG